MRIINRLRLHAVGSETVKLRQEPNGKSQKLSTYLALYDY